MSLSGVCLAVAGLAAVVLTSAPKNDAPPPPGPATPLAPTRILFSGNSFTYGPPARLPMQAYPDQGPLNNLPRILSLVARSLGVPVVTGEDTFGGCTAISHVQCNANAYGSAIGAPIGCERTMLKTGFATSRGYKEKDWDWPGGPVGPGGHSCASDDSCVADGNHTEHFGGGFPRLRDGVDDPAAAGYTTGPMTPFLPPDLAAHCAVPCASQRFPSHSGGGNSTCISSISSSRGTYHPCPQLALGPALGGSGGGGGGVSSSDEEPPPALAAWDYIVVQSHSAEAGVPRARELMFGPAFDAYGELAARQNATVVAYMTWGYPNGLLTDNYCKLITIA